MSKKLAKNLWMILPLLFLLTTCKGDRGPLGPEGPGVTLPYTKTTSSDDDAFSVTNSGTGRAGYFGGRVTATNIIESTSGGFKFPDGTVQITAEIDGEDLTLPYTGSISSSSDAFSVTNSGSGHAGYFGGKVTATNVIESTSGGFKFPDGRTQTEAFKLPYSGTTGVAGDAFSITETGLSGAGAFTIDNASNNDVALSAYTTGVGGAGRFTSSNDNAEDPTLDVSQFGIGSAGLFTINNYSNSAHALYVSTIGTGNAIYAITTGTGKAGYFDGDVHINGTLTKSSGQFIIDHPLDPENKILRHSFVEGPEMTNLYKGRAKLVNGTAVIELPGYFDALNHPEGREINLTCVNGWSPLYLDGEIKNNKFVIKTTKDGNNEQEFSWIIYGVRNDKYARENPIVVEQEKGVNNRFKKGEYLNPDVFGKKNDNK